MTAITDHTELIAAAHANVGHIVDMSLRERLIADLATALAQSELDLAEARRSESWMLEQKALMRDQRDRAEQKLAVQAATIEAVLKVTDDMRSGGWHLGKTVSEMGQKIYDILSSTDTNEEKTNE